MNNFISGFIYISLSPIAFRAEERIGTNLAIYRLETEQDTACAFILLKRTGHVFLGFALGLGFDLNRVFEDS